MPHFTAFAVTTAVCGPGETPGLETLKSAACEAAETAMKMAKRLNVETISLGSRRYRLIQGECRTNSEMFGGQLAVLGTFNGSLDPMDFEVYADNGFRKDPAGVPEGILRNNWNTTEELVRLALHNTTSRSTQNRREIFPDVFMDHRGTLLDSTGFPDEDVFGDTLTRDQDGPITVSRYLPDQDRAMAHHMAMAPLRKIARAQFEADYIRALASDPGRLVIQLDWNE